MTKSRRWPPAASGQAAERARGGVNEMTGLGCGGVRMCGKPRVIQGHVRLALEEEGAW